MTKYFVYILRCKNNQVYIGLTRNIIKRINDHKSGNGCQFTKNKLPIKLVYTEVYMNFFEAKNRENQIKKWRREKKKNLIKYGKPII